mmetsp:Transcript_108545/g.346457  ORF Transcript_108545/g.346457 Transcript_108545/m.346457 type:complete len:239 (-) Transcript_108545:284-1000(-)
MAARDEVAHGLVRDEPCEELRLVGPADEQRRPPGGPQRRPPQLRLQGRHVEGPGEDALQDDLAVLRANSNRLRLRSLHGRGGRHGGRTQRRGLHQHRRCDVPDKAAADSGGADRGIRGGAAGDDRGCRMLRLQHRRHSCRHLCSDGGRRRGVGVTDQLRRCFLSVRRSGAPRRRHALQRTLRREHRLHRRQRCGRWRIRRGHYWSACGPRRGVLRDDAHGHANGPRSRGRRSDDSHKN